MERTYTAGGTDVTETTMKSYMKLKNLLKIHGVDSGIVDSCPCLHALRLLGIKQGVLRLGEEEENEQGEAASSSSSHNESTLADKAEAAALAQSRVAEGADWFETHADEITEQLWLGSEEAAQDADSLRKHGITHIFVPAHGTSSGPPPLHQGAFQYKIWPVIDVPGYPIIRCFPAFVEAIEKLAPGEKALVHCVAGVSRSAAVVAAYLIKRNQEGRRPWEVDGTYSYIRRRRKVVSSRKFGDQVQLWRDLGCRLDKEDDESGASATLQNVFGLNRCQGAFREAARGDAQTDW